MIMSKPQDLTGQTFGDFTPIEYLGKSKWKCKCVKCGYETTKKQSTLMTWKNYCPECKSLVGKIFGDYEVLSQAETENKYEYIFHCKCIKCGAETQRTYNLLKRSNNRCQECNSEFGQRTDCKGYAEDLTGQTFGKLTVVEYIGKKLTHSLWRCQCECGNYCEKTVSQLHRGTNPMCPECLKPVTLSRAMDNIVGDRSENKVDNYGDYSVINDIILVDTEDVERLLAFKRKWQISAQGYAYITDKNHEQIFIHRYLTGLPDRYDPETQLIADHEDGNRLNNRKDNLRVIKKPENPINCGLYKNNTSGCKGVSWLERLGKWQVNIQYQKKNYYLGVYSDYNEAVRVRKEAEKKYFGDLNRKE